MADSERRPLGQQMLRGVGIFQAIVALPTMVLLGLTAYAWLFYHDGGLYYYFFAESITALMAAGIVFVVYVQRKAIVTSYQTLLFEVAKSTLATGLWLWLILDSAFGPWQDYYYVHPDVSRRIKRAALASILLFVLFYPPLGYSYVVWRREQDQETVGSDVEDDAVAGERTERTPLLT